MADDLVRSESPLEFFKAQVEHAMQRQQLRTSSWTEYYVVNLLAGFVALNRRAATVQVDDPLGMRLVRGLAADGAEQRDILRDVGDRSLFTAGFFADSLTRRLVDLDYYISLGGYAYARLAQQDGAFADVYGEMAEKFVPLVDVLAEISERAALTSNRNLLRVYDRWLRTGSRRDSALLAEKGLPPLPSSKRVQ